MSEDIARLPKWAQARIADLERTINVLRGELEDTRNQHPQTNVKVAAQMPGELDTTLPENSDVHFYLGPQRMKWFEMISVKVGTSDPRKLVVSGSGAGLLAITPRSSNIFEVRLSN